MPCFVVTAACGGGQNGLSQSVIPEAYRENNNLGRRILLKEAKKIGLGALAALAVYVVLLAVLSALIVRGTVEEKSIPLCVWLFVCAAAFAGARASAGREGEPAIRIAASTAAFWALIQLLGFLVNDTIEPARSVALVLPILVGGAAAYLVRPAREKRKRGRGKRRSRK